MNNPAIKRRLATKNHPRNQLQRSQESVFYNSDTAGLKDSRLAARPDYYGKPYPHMLIEDVSLGIMPVGGRTRRGTFRVTLMPTNKAAEEKVVSALARDSHQDGLADAVCDFFHNCAQWIMTYGEAPYEIVYLSRTGERTPLGFELVPIQPRTLMRRWGKLSQYLPEDVAKDRGLPQYVRLSQDRILLFTPPMGMGQSLRYVMEHLSHLSSPTFPDFALQKGESPSTIPYDSAHHIRTRKRALAEAGSPLGWNARSSLEDEFLEYYLLHRQLQFEKFKILLRECILATLNNGLMRAGKSLGFKGQLEISGLSTLTDVTTAQTKLTNGQGPFKEIIEPFLN